MTPMSDHPLDRATCPQCDRPSKTFRRYGGRLVCADCWTDEQAKNAACTCDTYGHCVVCQPEPDFEQIMLERAESRMPWWVNDPMYDGTPHRGQVPDHLATGFVL